MTNDTTPEAPLAELRRRWAEITDIEAAMSLLGWDQETNMPPGGAAARGDVAATLAGIHHARMTDPALRDALEAAADVDGAEAEVRAAQRAVDQSVKIPAELAQALARQQSQALVSWQKARAADDFSLFRDDLAEIVRLTCEQADALAAGTDRSRYDALLDLYEPDAREADLAVLFDGLVAELAPLVQAVADSGVTVDESPAHGEFPQEAQLAFGRLVAGRMGFDFDAGRIDRAAHPFCSTITRGDVRLTWRWEDDDFRPALFGIMHEAGHGLYEQGLPADAARTPIGAAVSLGVHESQSRLWENLVGRSDAFWRWALPEFATTFDVTAPGHDALVRAVNVVRPSLIRVEADEVTYNLHIAARFGIERALVAGDVSVDDVPALWDDTYSELLGIRPTSAADGVLQDIHWSMGAIGYFPTYTIGNLLASQLFEAATDTAGGLDGAFATGDFTALRDWLRTNVHAQGRRLLPGDLIEAATGAPLGTDAFMRHVRGITADVYGVAA